MKFECSVFKYLSNKEKYWILVKVWKANKIHKDLSKRKEEND